MDKQDFTYVPHLEAGEPVTLTEAESRRAVESDRYLTVALSAPRGAGKLN